MNINRSKINVLFPTEHHPVELWEALGRVVATFAFLEEILGKAIFALTGTMRYNEEDIQEEVKKWQSTIEKSLTGTLKPLAQMFQEAAEKHPDCNSCDVPDLICEIRKLSDIRNALCHGSWRPPNEEGKSKLFFLTRDLKEPETLLDVDFLNKTRLSAVEVTLSVIEVTCSTGYAFPGINGSGRSILGADVEGA